MVLLQAAKLSNFLKNKNKFDCFIREVDCSIRVVDCSIRVFNLNL